ncbi:RloB family protein [Spirulina sp. CS-785/01]|uniref:RloB family protein n=1 Tax=Spirulina sp. CS-785/01 TaxID=3021716 RepID=UPI00232A9DCD|nr:RloB family protein [Spirulina sp. CS-785/01]MDB9311750.1 RloB family protein [Spirulina sp. CS-785/01]
MGKSKYKHRGYHKRKTNNRELRQRFLIICEGEETEKNYFSKFRVPSIIIKIKGCGRNPSQLFNEINNNDPQDYDQVWLVFDRDNWTPQDIQKTIAQCKKNQYQVAYSNQCFELWYVLHFQFLNTALTRQDYSKKLDKLLDHPYAKNSESIYDELLDFQKTAIKNATRLLQNYNPPNPVKDDPSTTVHQLVQELNKYAH